MKKINYFKSNYIYLLLLCVCVLLLSNWSSQIQILDQGEVATVTSFLEESYISVYALLLFIPICIACRLFDVNGRYWEKYISIDGKDKKNTFIKLYLVGIGMLTIILAVSYVSFLLFVFEYWNFSNDLSLLNNILIFIKMLLSLYGVYTFNVMLMILCPKQRYVWILNVVFYLLFFLAYMIVKQFMFDRMYQTFGQIPFRTIFLGVLNGFYFFNPSGFLHPFDYSLEGVALLYIIIMIIVYLRIALKKFTLEKPTTFKNSIVVQLSSFVIIWIVVLLLVQTKASLITTIILFFLYIVGMNFTRLKNPISKPTLYQVCIFLIAFVSVNAFFYTFDETYGFGMNRFAISYEDSINISYYIIEEGAEGKYFSETLSISDAINKKEHGKKYEEFYNELMKLHDQQNEIQKNQHIGNAGKEGNFEFKVSIDTANETNESYYAYRVRKEDLAKINAIAKELGLAHMEEYQDKSND
ncbi:MULTISPECIES: hypothetical protein [unclassified Breznakia]|uniref:hypothetical protein n=1 Tax=unclassified Breznakia TaxID=2623764 RepID=UPI002405BADE|nr:MULTISPECIES: hypothetical protein [unclassified Breznakia]MDF9837062.1 hypothetical protein [Breznakia sp. PFB2-8]MDF9858987.1 hypothetical protein [Breznakia sp. PH5-24]